MTRPKIPDGDMNVTTARKRWKAVREAAYSGDPGAMIEAVSKFEGIADTIFMYWEERREESRGHHSVLPRLLTTSDTATHIGASAATELGLLLWAGPGLTPEDAERLSDRLMDFIMNAPEMAYLAAGTLVVPAAQMEGFKNVAV